MYNRSPFAHIYGEETLAITEPANDHRWPFSTRNARDAQFEERSTAMVVSRAMPAKSIVHGKYAEPMPAPGTIRHFTA